MRKTKGRSLYKMPIDLEELGQRQFEWAAKRMPAIKLARDYVEGKESNSFFKGTYLAACLHVSKESAVLLDALSSLGMKIRLVAANPLSSQDEIAAYLKKKTKQGIQVYGTRGESVENYRQEVKRAAGSNPDLIVDDGGELHVAYAEERRNSESSSCFGGTDETTSGTLRLNALQKHGLLRYPVIPVNEAKMKHLFDNKYGTGQSSIDGILRSTGILLAGKVVVVAGYGWVGKGVAMRAQGLGARVIVTEVDAARALEAHLDGYEVMPMRSTLNFGEVFLTCTGQIDVITIEEIKKMNDGAILANCGHFDMEIDVHGLRKQASKRRRVRENVEEYFLQGRSIFLLCEGRVVNLVAAEGHPPEIMQLSFATQLLSLYYLARHKGEFGKKGSVLPVPHEIEDLVSEFALSAFNLKIDRLSSKQEKYASSFIR